MAVDAIRNFVALDEGARRIGTAGQPSEEELRELAAAGYQAVINLGLLGQTYSLPDEAGLAAELGLGYRHIPVKFDAPTGDDLQAFVQTMDVWADQRVFVHCAANYRVSSFMALYGELRLGWDRRRADEHARRLWQPNETWQRFLDERRAELFGR
jgi:protein tyrosine phosphatase (PTP) superfamily phosphohydrolase (DUF442 family)